MKTQPTLRRESPFPLSVPIVVGALVGLLAAFQYWLHHRLFAAGVPWGEALLQRGAPYALHGLMAPFIVVFATRFPLRGGPWREKGWRTGLHLATGVLFVLVFEALLNAVHAALGRTEWTVRNLMWSVTGFGTMVLLLYFATVVATEAALHYREAREREVREARLEAGLSEARFDTLQAQLNPHFLFNTLNAITALARRKDHEEVVRVIGRLSDLLRGSLDGQRQQLVPFAEELDLLENYLAIQSVRFGDRLSIERDIAPAALSALVPNMLTQPLVENAFVHGIAGRRGPGRVVVRAARERGRFVFAVRDTGPGFAADVSSIREGIGLGHTRARLQMLYGGDALLTLGNHGEGGAFVTVSLPFASAALSA